VLTDLFGFTLLLPPCRRLYRRRILRWLKARFQLHTDFAGPGGAGGGRDEIIDSYVIQPPEERPGAQDGSLR
jgi:UPF0716 family protein affecting phage T7 exclusion